MKLAVGVLCLLSAVFERGARADCEQSPPRPATIDVYECNNLDTTGSDTRLENNAEGSGVLIRGTVTWKKGAAESSLRLWVPGSEQLGCQKLAGPMQLAATVEKVCCEPNTGAVCEAGANAVVSSAKVVPPPPVKKASRAQLETEVQKLRAENARLRSELFNVNERLRAENERLQQEMRVLDRKLK